MRKQKMKEIGYARISQVKFTEIWNNLKSIYRRFVWVKTQTDGTVILVTVKNLDNDEVKVHRYF